MDATRVLTLSRMLGKLTSEKAGVICNIAAVLAEAGNPHTLEEKLKELEIDNAGIDEMISYLCR